MEMGFSLWYSVILFCLCWDYTYAPLFTNDSVPFIQGSQPQGGSSYGQVNVSWKSIFEKVKCHCPEKLANFKIFFLQFTLNS